jgi:hypothetical protein
MATSEPTLMPGDFWEFQADLLNFGPIGMQLPHPLTVVRIAIFSRRTPRELLTAVGVDAAYVEKRDLLPDQPIVKIWEVVVNQPS